MRRFLFSWLARCELWIRRFGIGRVRFPRLSVYYRYYAFRVAMCLFWGGVVGLTVCGACRSWYSVWFGLGFGGGLFVVVCCAGFGFACCGLYDMVSVWVLRIWWFVVLCCFGCLFAVGLECFGILLIVLL